jgi:light-regulated signal transduction histidine kinase (bacteriophytochrome)
MIRAVSSMTGVDRIYAFRKIDPYDAYLSTGIAADAVFASWRHFLLIYGVLFTTAAAALMTLSLVALGRARKEQRATRHWREAMEQLTREMGLRTAAEARVGHLNEVLSQRAAELELANGELESFSYSVSHDLRAPLRAIDGFSQILLEDYAAKLDTEGQRLLNVVRDSTVKMSRMIDDILAFSRAGRTELATGSVDMSGLVRVAAQDLQAAVAGRKVSFKIGDLPEAHGDSAMLQRVWVNLLDNAVKYTSTRQEAEIEVGSTVGPDEIVYFVRDNGVGFDMEHVGKLFGVFQRLHGAEFPGTGIGLAIVKRIVTRHGGRVWAEGKVNEGATFYFALPKTGGGDG